MKKETISNQNAPTTSSDKQVGQRFLVRRCEFRDGIEWFPAKFHGWTKIQRCPIGDGSMLEWITHAILEKPNGEVDYEEPHRVRFIPANA